LAQDAEDEDEDAEDETGGLDATITTGPLPSADTLIRDVEELLRQERKNGSSQEENEENE
jgi:hypothetical protein